MKNGRAWIASKWTALEPRQREKHFIAIQFRQSAEVGLELELEAVRTKRRFWLATQQLSDEQKWRRGWH